jgi:hypothetical protein
MHSETGRAFGIGDERARDVERAITEWSGFVVDGLDWRERAAFAVGPQSRIRWIARCCSGIGTSPPSSPTLKPNGAFASLNWRARNRGPESRASPL